jgi:hypothetical protein
MASSGTPEAFSQLSTWIPIRTSHSSLLANTLEQFSLHLEVPALLTIPGQRLTPQLILEKQLARRSLLRRLLRRLTQSS